jgi:transcriptional regulator with XRE-family HTH domain
VGNERLRAAMAKAHLDARTVSQQTGVDPKTVQRWLNGRLPYARHRWTVSKLLGENETYLWPETMSAARSMEATRSELIELYPYRSALSPGLWWELLTRARTQIDILVYAALFLPEQHPDLNDLLRSKAAAGCRIRIVLGDPMSEQVRLRGMEERFGHGIEARCELAHMHYRPLLEVPGIEVNAHQTMLYNSIYRFDDELLVNAHIWGVNAYLAPVLHLRRLAGGSLFDTYSDSFDAVWETSRPISLERLT